MARRCQAAVAHANLLAQEVLFWGLESPLNEKPPDWAGAAPMWDETGESVRVRVGNVVIKSTWQVMLVGMTFIWGWNNPAMSPQYITAIIPPLPVPNTQAASLWRTLTNHVFMRPILRFKRFLAAVSAIFFNLNCTDQASSNTKLQDWELQQIPHTWISDSMPCMNHQTFLAYLYMVFACIGLGLINNMYACAMFLRMGNHALRCTLVIPQYVNDHVALRRGTPSRYDVLYIAEVKGFLKRLRRKTKAAKTKGSKPEEDTRGSRFIWVGYQQNNYGNAFLNSNSIRKANKLSFEVPPPP